MDKNKEVIEKKIVKSISKKIIIFIEVITISLVASFILVVGGYKTMEWLSNLGEINPFMPLIIVAAVLIACIIFLIKAFDDYMKS